MSRRARRLWALSTVLVALTHQSPATAVPVTITGKELYALKDVGAVSFPTTQPYVEGQALLFDDGSLPFEKLLSLPLGQFSGGSSSTVLVLLNLKVRPCDTSSGNCLGGGAGDWDPVLLVGDGKHIVGIQLSNDGQLFREVFTDIGTTGSRDGHYEFVPHTHVPTLGESLDIGLTLTLTDSSTTVTGLYDGRSESVVSPLALDRTQQLSFIFMRDNDAGEQHQVNTITVDAPGFVFPAPPIPTPEPTTLALLGLGFAGLGYSRHRRCS